MHIFLKIRLRFADENLSKVNLFIFFIFRTKGHLVNFFHCPSRVCFLWHVLYRTALFKVSCLFKLVGDLAIVLRK